VEDGKAVYTSTGELRKLREDMPDNWESIYSFTWEGSAERCAIYVENIYVANIYVSLKK